MHYPNDPRFTPDAFGDCPLHIVRQALQAIDNQLLVTASLYGAPAARFAAVYCNSHSKGGQFSERHFSPAKQILWSQAIAEVIPPRVARIMKEAWVSGKLPYWVLDYCDIQSIIEFADGLP